ncbi:MAG: sporulation protein YunB [Clostridia bacterium]|nr:sporulation protein YunB [Clostridia bacterium]
MLTVLVFWYIYAVVNPIVVETSEAKIKSLTQTTLSNSVLNIVSNEENLFDELVKYTYSNENKISLISVSSIKANLLARQITNHAQTQLDSVTSTGVEIHLGAFTGITVLASWGPLVKVGLSPIGTVTATFKSEFVSAGINQTVHKIFINLQSSVFVVLPTSSPKIDAHTEVLITETLVVGEIPSTYLQSSYLDEMLNLVPAG